MLRRTIGSIARVAAPASQCGTKPVAPCTSLLSTVTARMGNNVLRTTAAPSVASSSSTTTTTRMMSGYPTRSYYGYQHPPPPAPYYYAANPSPIGHWAPQPKPEWHATTILCVRKGKDVVLIGDGQVSMGPTVVKPNARKVRRIGNGKVMVGFAGATADAFSLVERLEAKLDEYPGQLLRACVETAKLWRTDKYLRHLDAVLIASDEHVSLEISGNGDVIEPHDGLLGVGSGGMYALAAARALIDIPDMDALAVAKKVRRATSAAAMTMMKLIVLIISVIVM